MYEIVQIRSLNDLTYFCFRHQPTQLQQSQLISQELLLLTLDQMPSLRSQHLSQTSQVSALMCVYLFVSIQKYMNIYYHTTYLLGIYIVPFLNPSIYMDIMTVLFIDNLYMWLSKMWQCPKTCIETEVTHSLFNPIKWKYLKDQTFEQMLYLIQLASKKYKHESNTMPVIYCFSE